MVGMGTVLLPEGFIRKVEEGDLEAALAHELAHVRRRDYAKNVGYAVLMLPVSYHPCAWLIRRAVGESREAVCDAMAAEVLESRRTYARSLLRLAMVIPAGMRGGATAAVGIFEGNTLERRVSLMMEQGKRLKGSAGGCDGGGDGAEWGGGREHGGDTCDGDERRMQRRGKGAGQQVPADVMASRIVSQVQPKYPRGSKGEEDSRKRGIECRDRERWKCRRPEGRVGAERASANRR